MSQLFSVIAQIISALGSTSWITQALSVQAPLKGCVLQEALVDHVAHRSLPLLNLFQCYFLTSRSLIVGHTLLVVP